MPSNDKPANRMDRLVAEARKAREQREQGYRARALKILPWICARCAREFTGTNVQLLTVHHKDGNHENNPPDGGNWELLCVYCHENEHARVLDSAGRGGPGSDEPEKPATHRPFAKLDSLLKNRK